MKITFVVPTLLFLAPTAEAASLRTATPVMPVEDSYHRNTALADHELCFSEFSFTAGEGCSYDVLLDRMKKKLSNNGRCSGRTAQMEVALILDMIGAPESEMKEAVATLCMEAFELERSATDVTFHDITGKPPVFTREFFNGGTYWNEARQTRHEGVVTDRLSEDPGVSLRQFNAISRKSIFTWPADVAENFGECPLRAAMCCWVQDRQAGDDNGNCKSDRGYDEQCDDADPKDNTDICYVDMRNAPVAARVHSGFSVFPGDDNDGEGPAHCHGFAWAQDENDVSAVFKANTLHYVSFFDHLVQRGYVRNVPGGPMCACVEKMPRVSRADCTEVTPTSVKTQYDYSEGGTLSVLIVGIQLAFNRCKGANGKNNDLEAHYENLVDNGKALDYELAKVREILVGEGGCPKAIRSLMESF